jgi:hypothetical protein
MMDRMVSATSTTATMAAQRRKMGWVAKYSVMVHPDLSGGGANACGSVK